MRYSAFSEMCVEKRVPLKMKIEKTLRMTGTREVHRVKDEKDLFTIRMEPVKTTPSMEGLAMIVYCETNPYDREYVSIYSFTGSSNFAIPGVVYVGDTMSKVIYRPIQDRRIESDYQEACTTFPDAMKVEKMLGILISFLRNLGNDEKEI